jgi:hypothetical protein
MPKTPLSWNNSVHKTALSRDFLLHSETPKIDASSRHTETPKFNSEKNKQINKQINPWSWHAESYSDGRLSIQREIFY